MVWKIDTEEKLLISKKFAAKLADLADITAWHLPPFDKIDYEAMLKPHTFRYLPFLWDILEESENPEQIKEAFIKVYKSNITHSINCDQEAYKILESIDDQIRTQLPSSPQINQTKIHKPLYPPAVEVIQDVFNANELTNFTYDKKVSKVFGKHHFVFCKDIPNGKVCIDLIIKDGRLYLYARVDIFVGFYREDFHIQRGLGKFFGILDSLFVDDAEELANNLSPYAELLAIFMPLVEKKCEEAYRTIEPMLAALKE